MVQKVTPRMHKGVCGVYTRPNHPAAAYRTDEEMTSKPAFKEFVEVQLSERNTNMDSLLGNRVFPLNRKMGKTTAC